MKFKIIKKHWANNFIFLKILYKQMIKIIKKFLIIIINVVIVMIITILNIKEYKKWSNKINK